jgi:hypothetical protein
MFGIGVVMIVPTFVLSGAVWQLFGSWFAVLGLDVVMVLAYTSIVFGWPMALGEKA